MSETGAVIDIIGLEYRPSELIGDVILFIRNSRRGQHSYTVAAIFFLDLAELIRNQIEGFIPTRFSELAVFFYQGSGKPLRRMNKVKTKASLDAKGAVVWNRILNTGDFDHFIVFYVQVHLASHAAITAGGAHLFGFPWPGTVANIFLNEGTHGAYLHTLTTKNAI